MNRALLFFILSCGLSWPFAGFLYFTPDIRPGLAGVMAFAYMCGPGLAGLFMAWRYHKGEQLSVLGLRWPRSLWWLWAYLIGLLIIGVSLVISLLGPNVGLQSPVAGMKTLMTNMGQNPGILEGFPFINLILVAQWVLLAPLINTPLMLSEELGWRGWLYSELRPSGFWHVSAITGLMWGLWHVPIIAAGHNYPGYPVLGSLAFTTFCLLYAPLFTLVRDKTKSVWGACILHATTNGAAALSIVTLTDPPLHWSGLLGIGGFAALLLSLLMIFLFAKALVTKAV